MKKNYILIVFFFLLACKKNPEPILQPQQQHFIPYAQEVAEETYHTDTAYKYKSRVGVPGDYQYNYDVSGIDSNGDEVTGNITVRNKYGEGTLTDANGNEVEIETEWIGYGRLKATDEDGNEYKLGVD